MEHEKHIMKGGKMMSDKEMKEGKKEHQKEKMKKKRKMTSDGVMYA